MIFRRSTPTPLPPKPECHEVGAVLQSYLDGELGPQDAELVAEHLEHCERCEIEATTVTRVVHAIRRQRPDLESDALTRLHRFVDELTDHGPQDPAEG
jgi:anti-sigma factor RsiW